RGVPPAGTAAGGPEESSTFRPPGSSGVVFPLGWGSEQRLIMARERPNFLFFIADQLRFDHLGCYGNRVVRTPNIDAVAVQGFAADRFYVASPICMPNRGSLMTGRMP